MLISEKKTEHEQLVYMYQWFACHLWGFRNAQEISWPNAENYNAAPPPPEQLAS